MTKLTTIIFNDPNSEPPKNWIWQKNNSHYVYNHSLRKWVESGIAYPFIKGLKQILSYNDDEPPKNYLWYKNDSILKYEYDKWKSNDSEHDYSKDYLTFEITNDGYINWGTSNVSGAKTIEYSKNGGEWTEITSTTEGAHIDVVSGDIVQFRGNNNTYVDGYLENEYYSVTFYSNFADTTCGFNLYGNIMSLFNSTNFVNLTEFPQNTASNFLWFFAECTGLTDASKLILPVISLTMSCYSEMFSNCTSLITAPELPATTLADGCYFAMFGGCTSLTTAPELPATTLADNCYGGMFYGCSSLVTAPELPATTLAENCYNQMFGECGSLVTASELPATSLAPYCYQEMFYLCTSLATAPELSATTLTDYCYDNMFYDCESLNYIKCLATDISANHCTSTWVSGVASTGTFVKAVDMNDWPTGSGGIPEGWTVEDAS